MSDVVLEMKNISKYFYGVPAIKDVNFELREGEVHALMGENGAGKSTLSKVIAGIYKADEGEMYIRGEACKFNNAREANDHGVAMVTQEFSLMKDFSVAENIFLTSPAYYKHGFLSDKKAMVEKTWDLLKLFHMEKYISPYEKASDLSVAQMQIVEIVKAISKNASILILDEPTASLTEREIKLLFDLIRDMKKKKVSFIIVSHKINEIYEISDRITVLRDGKYIIGNVNTKELKEQDLIRAMVGREVQNVYGETTLRDFSKEKVVFEVQNLNDTRDFVKDINFTAHSGEIIGFSGLLGAGRTEMARCIFGADNRNKDSKVIVNGKEIAPNSIKAALRSGLAYVSEDRKYDGLFQDLSISNNINMEDLVTGSRKLTSVKDEDNSCAEMQKALQIKMESNDLPVHSLSGGNQQKVLLAKWMLIHPKVIIVDEPTRGVDIGAKSDIYKIIRNWASEGVAVIVISSEMQEVMGLSNTVYVMREGMITGKLSGDEISEERIGYLETLG